MIPENRQSASTARLLLFVLVLLLGQGCRSLKDPHEALEETKNLAPPVPVHRPSRELARRFGLMSEGYYKRDQAYVLEVPLVPNDSGVSKDLPRDLGQYVVQAINDLGTHFTSYRSSNPAGLLDTPAAQALILAASEDKRPQPKTDFRITGTLMRSAERVVKARDLRGDALFKMEGKSIDAQLGAEDRVVLTSVRVGLSLEGPDRLMRPGGTTTVELFVMRTEDSSFAGLYIAGTGIGGSSRLEANQDVGDALYDITVRCLIQLLGNALALPYWRLDSSFEHDQSVVEYVRAELAGGTKDDLEWFLKEYLYLSGLVPDSNSLTMTPDERRVARLEMRKRGIDPDRRTQMPSWHMPCGCISTSKRPPKRGETIGSNRFVKQRAPSRTSRPRRSPKRRRTPHERALARTAMPELWSH